MIKHGESIGWRRSSERGAGWQVEMKGDQYVYSQRTVNI